RWCGRDTPTGSPLPGGSSEGRGRLWVPCTPLPLLRGTAAARSPVPVILVRPRRLVIRLGAAGATPAPGRSAYDAFTLPASGPAQPRRDEGARARPFSKRRRQ